MQECKKAELLELFLYLHLSQRTAALNPHSTPDKHNLGAETSLRAGLVRRAREPLHRNYLQTNNRTGKFALCCRRDVRLLDIQ